jgi:predicted ATPase
MTDAQVPPLDEIQLSFAQVFPGGNEAVFFQSRGWCHPVSFFVGRNGSGKSRTAKLVAQRLGGRYLSTDRLSGLMNYTNYGWTAVPEMSGYKGVPLGDAERGIAASVSQNQGSAIGELYALKDQPEVWLRVAAFLRRALGRVIELRENAGFLDPYVRIGSMEYSLLRDEGHGLRELVILLTAIYREDWNLLVVDEPELHLHPSMTRLWLSELERECRSRGKHALVVTHEPTMLKPAQSADLAAIWLFAAGQASTVIADHVAVGTENRVTSSLQVNPQLISQVVFSPRPVLVEGIHDVAALSVSLSRTQPSEVVAQTDLVECGGSGGVALWFSITKSMGLDTRAVADLDACLAPEVQTVMDSDPEVARRYRADLAVEPPKSHLALRPLIEAMNSEGVANSPKERAAWMASSVPPATGWAARASKFQEIWRDAGFWLHPQGTLENVLGIDQKSRTAAQEAASRPGPIDVVAKWAAFILDPKGDVELLLGAAVERMAHSIMEALRIDPDASFDKPVGGSAISDARLVTVQARGNGTHRITVVKPDAFKGSWVEFSRDTPSRALQLLPPEAAD